MERLERSSVVFLNPNTNFRNMDISWNESANGLCAAGSDKVKWNVRKWLHKETDDGHRLTGSSALWKQKI